MDIIFFSDEYHFAIAYLDDIFIPYYVLRSTNRPRTKSHDSTERCWGTTQVKQMRVLQKLSRFSWRLHQTCTHENQVTQGWLALLLTETCYYYRVTLFLWSFQCNSLVWTGVSTNLNTPYPTNGKVTASRLQENIRQWPRRTAYTTGTALLSTDAPFSMITRH